MVEGRQLSLLPSSTKKNNKKDAQLCFNMNNHGRMLEINGRVTGTLWDSES